MLGRLKFTIEEAISAYDTLAPKIFKSKWWSRTKTLKNLGAESSGYWCDPANMQDAIQDLLSRSGQDPELSLFEQTPRCRV